MASSETVARPAATSGVRQRGAFEPTERHVALLQAAQEHGYDLRVVDLCELAKVPARTYYNWFQNAGFARWWSENAECYFALQAPRVLAALFAAATDENPTRKEKPNPRAIELFLRRYDAMCSAGRDREPAEQADDSIQDLCRRVREILEDNARE